MLVKRSAILAACVGVFTATTYAAVVVVPFNGNVQGSGNGTIDPRLMTFSGGQVENVVMDDANNTLPQGGGSDTGSFAESYVTTAGELQTFYTSSNFTPQVSDITLFVDFNETNPGASTNVLTTLYVVLNPGNVPDATGDVNSADQAAIDQTYTGGTLLASYSGTLNMPVNNQGAGFADWAILTGVDPYAYANDDVILFDIRMTNLSDGGEEVFLSGEFSGADVPEPAAVLTLAMSGLLLLRKKRAAA